jgi:hypothetical protein
MLNKRYSSENVAGAFVDRLFGFPVVGIFFHPVFGAAFYLAIKLVSLTFFLFALLFQF